MVFVHVMPKVDPEVSVPGVGLADCDQALPFQYSMSVRSSPDAFSYQPTAQQSDAVTHVTA